MAVKASIYLSGIIMPSEWAWFDEPHISLATVQKAIGSVGQFDELSITIDTDGGVMEEGWKIYDYLKSLGKPIHTIGIGIVASMGTILFSLGQTRLLSQHCKFMVHLPSGEGWGGNKLDIQEYLDLLIAEEKQILDIYTSVTGKDESEIAALLADGKDHYFTAPEAMGYGWATGIYQRDSLVVAARNAHRAPVMARLADGRKGLGLSNTKPTTSIMASLTETFNEFLAKVQKVVTGTPTNLAVSTADGQSLVIETGDRTEYAVGDAVTVDGQPVADGDYILSDNATITVVEGLITVITPATTEEESAEAEAEETVTIAKAEHERLLALDTEVTSLKESVTALQAKSTEYDTVTAQMRAQLSTIKSANPLAPKLPEVKPVGNTREVIEESDPVARKQARIAARNGK